MATSILSEQKAAVERRMRDLVRQGFSPAFGEGKAEMKTDPEWRKIRDTGTRLWLDTGDIDEAAKLFTAEFEALTTNNTLLNKEVQKGLYDDLVGEAAAALREIAPGVDERDLLLEIAFVLNARHGLRLVERFDSYVSVELHTDLAHDVVASVAYGKRLYAVCPERFIVKVPLTPAGLLAARRLREDRVPVNFTLGFSARQNYLASLLAQPNYVNVFMGRLNAFVADYGLGSGENIGEKATLATQRTVNGLRSAGRPASLLIGASMRKGAQVAALAGLDVFTMPTKVAQEYRENPAAEVESRVNDDPEVPLEAGVSLDDFYGASLWEVSGGFKGAVEGLLNLPVDKLTPEAITTHLEQNGHGDIFPAWTEAEVEQAAKDGKIPVYDTWKEQLREKRIGLDALMNLSALQSFASDQSALDARVKSLL